MNCYNNYRYQWDPLFNTEIIFFYLLNYIKAEDLAPEYRFDGTRPSKLDPFKEYILKRMLKNECTNAVLIFEETCEKGYTGKLTILRDFNLTEN